MLVSSKIPLYVEAPPGPGSQAVIRCAFANGRTDYIDHNTIHTLPSVPEVIEISSSSSSPPSADSKHPSHRSTRQPKKAKTPDSDNFPLHRARKRTSKKSKPVVSDSDEISDANDLEPQGIKKGKVVDKAVIRVAKGKERAVGVKKAPIDIDATKGGEASLSAAPPATTSRKQWSPPIMTAANTSNAPPSTKLVPRPFSEWAVAARALAAANMGRTAADTTSEITSSPNLASKEPIAALQSTSEQPISTTKPKPRPVKKPTAVIWDNGDPFLKPSGEQQLQGPGHPPKARTQPASLTTAAPLTTSTQTQSMPSALGPPRLPSMTPTQSTSKPSSKRTADSQKATHTASNKKPRTVNEVAEASEEELASEEPTAVGPSEEDVAAESTAQGYQWPYGGYYPPYSYPPPPGWGYQPWSQDRPAGSGAPGLDVPHFPPPHPGLPYPPPHGYYPPAAAARPTYAKPPAKPAKGEPGPSRLT